MQIWLLAITVDGSEILVGDLAALQDVHEHGLCLTPIRDPRDLLESLALDFGVEYGFLAKGGSNGGRWQSIQLLVKNGVLFLPKVLETFQAAPLVDS